MFREAETGKMNIGGFIPLSLVDWDGHPCSVVFTRGCNFRCPWCISKESKILMSDYSWKNIENIHIEDKLIGLSENPKSSKFVETKVTKIFKRETNTILDIELENGLHLKITPEHKVLSMRPQRHWYRAENLLGKQIIFLGNPSETTEDFLRGWMAGIMDGDGCFWTSKYGYKHASLRMSYPNQKLVELFHALLINLGYKPHYKKHKRLVQSCLSNIY